MDIAKVKSVLEKENISTTASDDEISAVLLAASFTPTEVDTALVLLSMPDPNAPKAKKKPKAKEKAKKKADKPAKENDKKPAPVVAAEDDVVEEVEIIDGPAEPSFFGKLVESVADVKIARSVAEDELQQPEVVLTHEPLPVKVPQPESIPQPPEPVFVPPSEPVVTEPPVQKEPVSEPVLLTPQPPAPPVEAPKLQPVPEPVAANAQPVLAPAPVPAKPTHPAIPKPDVAATFKKLAKIVHRPESSAKPKKSYGFSFVPNAIRNPKKPTASKPTPPPKPKPRVVKPTLAASAPKARPLYKKLAPVAAPAMNGSSKLFYSSETLSSQEIHQLLGIDVRLDTVRERQALGDRSFGGWQFALVWFFAAIFAIAGIGYYMYIEEIGIFHESVASTPFDPYLPER